WRRPGGRCRAVARTSRLRRSTHAPGFLRQAPRHAGNPSLTQSGNVMIRFETTLGDFSVELFEEDAPLSAANFLGYIDDGFFDGTIFHRIVPGFVIQGGGFTEDMSHKRTQASIKKI